MKKTVLFGAGQAGAMAARLLGGDYAAVCFADNAPEKRGGSLAGLPIVSPEEALALGPDCVCLCVLDAERASQMEAQLRALGYAGPLLRAWGKHRALRRIRVLPCPLRRTGIH